MSDFSGLLSVLMDSPRNNGPRNTDTFDGPLGVRMNRVGLYI